VNLIVQRNIPVTFTKTAVTVINETVDPEPTPPKILKALPAHSPSVTKKSHPSSRPVEIRKAMSLEQRKKEKHNGE